MAAASEIVDDYVEFGFNWRDMYDEILPGSFRPYERHVFLCYEDLLDRDRASFGSNRLRKRLAGAIRDLNKATAVQTRVNICNGGDGNGLLDGDIMIIPDMINYRGVEEWNIENFVNEVLKNGKAWALGTQEVVTGSFVFVCTYSGGRDKRCSICGPALIKKFIEEIEPRGLKDKVFVSGYLDRASHQFAGHLAIYRTAEDGKVSGHLYGYITPGDVAELLDICIERGEIIEWWWRGQMGAIPAEKAEKAIEQTLPNGNDPKVSEKISNEKENTSSRAKKSISVVKALATVAGAVAAVAVTLILSNRSRKKVKP